jgi:hypothetical protein
VCQIAGRYTGPHGPATEHGGAVGQNRTRSIEWAEKQEKFQPKEMYFLLTSPFIVTRHVDVKLRGKGDASASAKSSRLLFALRFRPLASIASFDN